MVRGVGKRRANNISSPTQGGKAGLFVMLSLYFNIISPNKYFQQFQIYFYLLALAGLYFVSRYFLDDNSSTHKTNTESDEGDIASWAEFLLKHSPFLHFFLNDETYLGKTLNAKGDEDSLWLFYTHLWNDSPGSLSEKVSSFLASLLYSRNTSEIEITNASNQGEEFQLSLFKYLPPLDSLDETQRGDQAEAGVVISISDATVMEGGFDTMAPMTFMVTLSSASDIPVTLYYGTEGGALYGHATEGLTASALINPDFDQRFGQLTFAPGETEKTIMVDVYGDNMHERDETFVLRLFNADNALIGDAQGIGIIMNDDTPPLTLTPPLLNSNPMASNALFIDFLGGGSDFISFGNTIFPSGAYNRDEDVQTFSKIELREMEEIWRGVAENYAPFDVNITTDQSVYEAMPSTNASKITHISETVNPFEGAVGLAWLDTFHLSLDEFNSFVPSTSNTFSWFVPTLIDYTTQLTATIISHELGHVLSLQHAGTDTKEYYRGHDSATGGWQPIMGAGRENIVSQWSNANYEGGNTRDYELNESTNRFELVLKKNPAQDDIETLTEKLGVRKDEVGDSFDATTQIEVGLFLEGIIETAADVDMFEFEVNSDFGILEFVVNAFQPTVKERAPNDGANLDIKAILYNEAKEEIQISNPEDSLNAHIIHDLNEYNGSFYFSVEGAGYTGEDFNAGSYDYGSLGYYQVESSIA